MCAKRKKAEKKQVLVSDEFYSDMTSADMLHATIVRSPFSCGRIASLSLPPNSKLPDGYGLIESSDIPGKRKINILGCDIPLLASEEIEYKGQNLALLYGKEQELLSELKQNIQIELSGESIKKTEASFKANYDRLSLSLKDGSPIEENISPQNSLAFLQKSNEIIAKRKVKIGNPAEIFADETKSAFIIGGKWKEKINFSSNRECDGVFCCIKSGIMQVYTPCKWTEQIRSSVSEASLFPIEKIVVTRTKTSGEGSNNLWQNAIFASLAALAVIKSGKAVLLKLSREEQEKFVDLAPSIDFTCKAALDKNGLINALDISIDYDTGAYNPFIQDCIDSLCISACGIYNCKNVIIKARAFKSHNPPCSPSMRLISSYSFFAIENLIQKIADITGFSPVDLRQMNKAGGLQKATKPYTFYFGRSSDAINAIAIRSDFKRKYTVSRLAEKTNVDDGKGYYTPPQKGLGLACAFEGAGHIGKNFDKSNISLQVSVSEEKKLIVHAIPSSCSIKENWIKLITDSLEIEKKNIVFDLPVIEDSGKKYKPSQMPDDFIGNASVKTILLQKCLNSIKRRKWDDAPFSVKKSLYSQRKKIWNSETFSGSPCYNTAFGTCTVELEIDPCTMREKISKICVIIDGGKIINPKAAENAVYRSIQSCLTSLVEGCSLSADKISVQFMQSEDEPKQIGNIIYSILPAAYTSALSQAIDINIESLPLKTDTLFKLMEKKSKDTKIESEEEK